ncbi:hypothetical protein EBT31_20490 [bacterium]|nr:hypothetical protein [bacterium]
MLRDREMNRGLTSGPEVDQAISRYMGMARALQLFQSGAGANLTGMVARYAQSLGMTDTATAIAGGQISAQEWLEKEGVMAALTQLAASNPRFANAEFQVLRSTGMPEPGKTPAANMQVLVSGLGALLRERQFQNDWVEAQKAGWTSPSTFYSAWSQVNQEDVYKNAARRMIGNLRGMPLPDNVRENWVPGQVYVMPPRVSNELRNLPGMSSLRANQPFRFNGWQASETITPLTPQEAYAAGAH